MQQQQHEMTELPLFVYGSLKRGYGANARYLQSEKFVDCGVINGTLVNLGAFPGFIQKGTDLVKGELYELSKQALASVDRYEGNGSLYDRIMVTVTMPDGRNLRAWTYEFSRKDDKFVEQNRIPTGEWHGQFKVTSVQADKP